MIHELIIVSLRLLICIPTLNEMYPRTFFFNFLSASCAKHQILGVPRPNVSKNCQHDNKTNVYTFITCPQTTTTCFFSSGKSLFQFGYISTRVYQTTKSPASRCLFTLLADCSEKHVRTCYKRTHEPRVPYRGAWTLGGNNSLKCWRWNYRRDHWPVMCRTAYQCWMLSVPLLTLGQQVQSRLWTTK